MYENVKEVLTRLKVDNGLTKTAREVYNDNGHLTHDEMINKFLDMVNGTIIASGNSFNDGALSEKIIADYVWCEFSLDGNEYLYVVVGDDGCDSRVIYGNPVVCRATHGDLRNLVFELSDD